MLRQRVPLLLLLLTVCAPAAHANPLEDGTRISLFAGGRYVPHDHFERLARESGYPLKSAWRFGPEALLSFSYAPQPQAELSLEVGYAADQYELPASTLSVMSIPLVATLRYFPFEPGRLSPYLGLGRPHRAAPLFGRSRACFGTWLGGVQQQSPWSVSRSARRCSEEGTRLVVEIRAIFAPRREQ